MSDEVPIWVHTTRQEGKPTTKRFRIGSSMWLHFYILKIPRHCLICLILIVIYIPVLFGIAMIKPISDFVVLAKLPSQTVDGESRGSRGAREESQCLLSFLCSGDHGCSRLAAVYICFRASASQIVINCALLVSFYIQINMAVQPLHQLSMGRLRF